MQSLPEDHFQHVQFPKGPQKGFFLTRIGPAAQAAAHPNGVLMEIYTRYNRTNSDSVDSMEFFFNEAALRLCEDAGISLPRSYGAFHRSGMPKDVQVQLRKVVAVSQG